MKLSTKIFFNSVRYNYYVSLFLTSILSPIYRLCRAIEEQIRIKIWINGRLVDYDGVKLNFPRDVGVFFCSDIFWNGDQAVEPATYQVIKFFILRSEVFLDIGANIGFYSVIASKINQNILVVAFEPVPAIHQRGVTFLIANQLNPKIIRNEAIGDRIGEADIYLPLNKERPEEEGTATIRRDSWQFRKSHDLFSVAITTIDKVMEDIGSPKSLFIKVDVEDFEASVINGASKTLDLIKPYIVCEILPRDHGNQETARILENHNYQMFGISRDGLIKFTAIDLASQRKFTDFLLVPTCKAPELNYIPYGALHQHFPVAGPINLELVRNKIN